MIKVSYAPLYNGFVFECEGHAGYAVKGKDIVCAGASALCLALKNRMEELEAESETKSTQISVTDGYMYVRCEYGDDAFSRDRAESSVKTVMAGFDAVQTLYPEYLILE